MLRNKMFKKQNGSISIYVIATVFSFIFILSGIFFRSNVIRKNQFRTLMKIKEIYAQDLRTKEIAQIDDKIYPSIQLAVDAIANNGEETTILLLRDTTESINIPEGKNIILDLANCTVTGDATNPTITSSGTLTVKGGTLTSANNSTIKNSGTLNIINTANIGNDSGGNDYASIYTTEGATTTISGGTITSKRIAIENAGALEISGTANIIGTLTADFPGAIYIAKGATAIISGGKITFEGRNGIENNGTLEINGNAHITGKIDNFTELSISGGTITSNVGCVVNHNGGKTNISGTANIINTLSNEPAIYSFSDTTTTISGGTLTSENYIAIFDGGGTTTITRGTITSENSDTILSVGTLNISGNANIICNGTNSTAIKIANSSSGTLNMTGGTVISKGKYGIWLFSAKKVTISGGTIDGRNANYAIYNELDLITPSISGATIYGKTYGI